MKPVVIIERFPFGDERDSKWVRLMGYLEEVPVQYRLTHPVTRVETINTASLVSGGVKLTEVRDDLKQKVEGYAESWTAANEQLKEL